MSDWDVPGIVDRFRELVLLPHVSYAAAAAALNGEFKTNLTRNAAIGKADRLGLEIAESKRRSLIAHPEKNRRVKPGRPRREPGVRTVRTEQTICDLPPETSPFAISLFDIGPHQCRWPVDGHLMFCGAESVAGSSWCECHGKRVWDRT